LLKLITVSWPNNTSSHLFKPIALWDQFYFNLFNSFKAGACPASSIYDELHELPSFQNIQG
jgi:hypothetical protein